MQKKLDLYELDIPTNDLECWERYPKHRWVYDLSRLLDTQGIKWTPFKSDSLSKVNGMNLTTTDAVEYSPAAIYMQRPVGKSVISEVYIIKGEIRYTRYFDRDTMTQLIDDIGNVDIRINAFVAIHFHKFTGVITISTTGANIYEIQLRPLRDTSITDPEITKLIKRIYKKSEECII
jgi:hypothetical protein